MSVYLLFLGTHQQREYIAMSTQKRYAVVYKSKHRIDNQVYTTKQETAGQAIDKLFKLMPDCDFIAVYLHCVDVDEYYNVRG